MRAVLAAVCLMGLAQGQTPPPFRSGVSLVTVDVTVLDADGLPVPGLTAADFEVRLDNRVQPIRAVTYLRIAESMAGAVGPAFDAAPPSRAAAVASNATTAPRVFVVLVDDLSFSPLAGKELFAATHRFVASLPETDRVGLATTSGTAAVNPSADRTAVLAALPKIAGTFQDPRIQSSGPSTRRAETPDQSVGIAQSLDIDRGDASVLRQAIANECFGGDLREASTGTVEQLLAENTCARQVQLDALRTAAQMKMLVQRQAQACEAVIRAMRNASGIRHLLVVTGGVALSQDLPSMAPVARAAAETGVQMSVLMATPEMSLSDGGRRTAGQVDMGAPQRRREDSQMLLNGARTAADMAGGEFYPITGEPDRFFERVRTAASAVYRLAVEAPPETQAGKDFSLSARVLKRTNVTARTARRAVAALPASAAAPTASPSPSAAVVTPAEQRKRAIASGRTLTGLDVSIEPSIRRAADPAQIAIEVTVVVAPGARAPLATTLGLVDAAGAIRTSDKTIDAPDGDGHYRLRFAVPVAPGAYKLRFAASDAAGTLGSSEAAVDAALVAMGPVRASGVAIEPLPGSRRGVLASIELYPADGAAAGDVLVKMTLVSGSTAGAERVIVPEPIDGALRAEAEFLLEGLPPGPASIRVAVLSGATVLGTVTRALPR